MQSSVGSPCNHRPYLVMSKGARCALDKSGGGNGWRGSTRPVLAGHWRQKMGRRITAIEDDLAAIDSGEAIVSDAPSKAFAMLVRLPERYGRILELRFLQGLSVRDAAGELGVSVANAKVLQYRAFRMAAQLG